MQFAILGAGPAGLYLAYLIKRRQPGSDVIVVEQNPADATFGFGVVFSDRALEFLREDDPETYTAIVPHMESWNDIAIVHRGERIVIDGIGFAAIGRLKLLELLQARVRSVGVVPVYRRTVKSLDELAGADLVIGADGVNSLVRRSSEQEFGASVRLLTNRFAWFGTTRRFETLTQTFVESEFGSFNAHHYRYAPGASTFIVEVNADTFARANFAGMDENDTRALCERVFAQALDGHALISNNSIWRQFPIVHNERWFVGRSVLIGDALHTIFPSGQARGSLWRTRSFSIKRWQRIVMILMRRLLPLKSRAGRSWKSWLRALTAVPIGMSISTSICGSIRPTLR
jgi:2-polyprenyl-6-methoxyphenol hydroxylase-like FAD-dependent oxidoreductase